MNQTLSKTKKPRIVGILFLFGAVTIVIGCARVQRTSFADFWPAEPFKKTAGKVAGLVRPGKDEDSTKKNEKTQLAETKTGDKSSPSEQKGTGERKSWGARLVSVVGGDRDKSSTEVSSQTRASGLLYDPFLTPAQRVGSAKENEAAGKDLLADGLHPSDKGTNPFAERAQKQQKQLAQNAERRPERAQTRTPETRVVASDSEKDNPFAAWDKNRSQSAQEVTSPESNPAADTPAFADTFNSQMDRLREEMNETDPQATASAAPEPDFDFSAPNSPQREESAGDQSIASQDELPEFTQYASHSRKSPPTQDFADAMQSSEPAKAPETQWARTLSAPQLQTATRPATGHAPLPAITPRRPVQRTAYSTPGFATVKFPQAPRTNSSTADFKSAATREQQPVESPSLQAPLKRPETAAVEVLAASPGAPQTRNAVETGVPREAADAEPVEGVPARTVADTRAMEAPAQAELRHSRRGSMIFSTRQLPSRAEIRRGQRAAASLETEIDVNVSQNEMTADENLPMNSPVSGTSDRADAAKQGEPVSGPNRAVAIAGNGSAEVSELNASRAMNVVPAEPSLPSGRNVSAHDEAGSRTAVETASFADGAGPVVLADAGDATPIATTPLDAVDWPLENEVVAVTPAQNAGSKWPPIVLGIAVAITLFLFAHRRLRAGM